MFLRISFHGMYWNKNKFDRGASSGMFHFTAPAFVEEIWRRSPKFSAAHWLLLTGRAVLLPTTTTTPVMCPDVAV